MAPKVKEVFKESHNLGLSDFDNFPVFTSEEIERFFLFLNVLRRKQWEKESLKEKTPIWISVKEAANYLGVTPQTIYNNTNSGNIESIRAGRSIRIDKNKLNNYNFISSISNNYVYCKSDIICIDKKAGTMMPFEEGFPYRLMRSNKIWHYIFSDAWDCSFRVGMKQFKKNFAGPGDLEYNAYKYNIMPKKRVEPIFKRL
jgi:excisionase family DNA binding protein